MCVLKRYRSLLLQVIDLCLWMFGVVAAMVLTRARGIFQIEIFLMIAAIHVVIYHFCGMYQVIWRYAGIRQFVRCLLCEVTSYTVAWLIGTMVLHRHIDRFCITGAICTALIVISSRMGYAAWISWQHGGIRSAAQKGTRTLIIGAGEAARILLMDMQQDEKRTYVPVGLLDDDPAKWGRKLWNTKVYGPIEDVKRFAKQLDAQIIVFAIFGISKERRRGVLELCAKTGVKVMMAPSPKELHEMQEGVSQRLRSVDVNDLLGREPILLDEPATRESIKDHTILVTGGGGSIGSELCRQIASMKPKKLVILDVYENGAYDLQQELRRTYGTALDLSVEIVTICDKPLLERIFRRYRPEIIFHAAAHKHVPLMENGLEEAVKNNIFGTLNVVELADKYKVKRFVMISTDKAVNPTNIMGATKRCCELIVQTMNRRSSTEYVAVRFGNVLGSNGSVVPLFSKQIAEGGPVTVTHPDIIRYFMTIPEAVRLVLTASSMAVGGEIFVLDMGEPVKILDLAENMICLVGLEPYKDIPIVFSGLRPGEKLFEELLLSEEGTRTTEHEKIFVAMPLEVDEAVFWDKLKHLRAAAQWGNEEAEMRLLRDLVPTYHQEQMQQERIRA